MPALSQAAEQVSANVGRRIGAAPAAAILAIAALAAAQPLDADLWIHLNNGRFIASRGELPYPDPFTFSAGDAVWTVHEWLPALIIFQLVDLGGVIAAVLGIAAVYALIWGLLERTLAAHGVGPWMRTAALVTASLPLFPFAGIRPLAFGLLAAVLTAVLALHHRRTGSRWIWLLPLMFVIWGNVHASFPIGFALLGTLLFEALWARSRLPFIGPRPRTRLGPFAAAMAMSVVAPALNPSGVRLLAQPFFQWGGEFRRFNSDWRPPEAFSETWWFFAAFLVLLGLLLILRRARIEPAMLGLLILVLAAGLSTRKVMPFAAVLAPLLVAYPLATASAARLPLPGWAVQASAALAVAATFGVAAAVSPRTLDGPSVVPMPTAARDLVADTGATRIFGTYHWGAFLTWALWPDARVFIDGRFDLFVPDALGDYLSVTGLEPGWRQKLMDIDPDAVVIQTDSPLARRLAQPGSGWRDIGGDSIARVLLPDRARSA
ncbi:MAG: hypothetical protein OXR64_13955 [Chloroflexota bacterium]|nr:hypothetical protein [Chloroflexota bacterium]MDE2920934.1 hypothetical protein [Chloroflexota bacterium]